MQKFEVQIEGVTPYMQCRMDTQKLEDWEKSRGFVVERDDVNKDDLTRAMFHAYLDDKGNPYMPSEHIMGCLINAGTYVKSKVGAKTISMKGIVAGMFSINPENLPLSKNWVIDKRSGVNQRIKARIVVIRPKWEQWKINFVLEVDNDTVTQQMVEKIIENGGQYVGLGSFRPEKRGRFGRYKLNKIKKII